MSAVRTAARLTAAAMAAVTAGGGAWIATPAAQAAPCRNTVNATAEASVAADKVAELTHVTYRPVATQNAIDSCAPLSWAVLARRDAPERKLVALFHHGQFAGLAHHCALPIARVGPRPAASTVTITYPVIGAAAPWPEVGVPITYRWSGDRPTGSGTPPVSIELENHCRR